MGMCVRVCVRMRAVFPVALSIEPGQTQKLRSCTCIALLLFF